MVLLDIVVRDALYPVVLEGLRRLEYRGYDSAGIVYLEDDRADQTSRSRKAGQS